MKTTLFGVFVTALLACASSSNLEHDGSVRIHLAHSLTTESTPQFVPRANITIESLRSGGEVIEQNPITPEDRTKLLELASKNLLYHVRATVLAQDGSKRTFFSTLKACMLVESGLDDRLLVALDYGGRVVAVNAFVAAKSTCEGAVVPTDKLKSFSTSVYVKHSERGPEPDTATYVEKLKQEKVAKERGEGKDNRSFLAKYWMYIVPVVVIMMISSMANPDGASGGAAR